MFSIVFEKQISDVAEGIKDVMTKSELADMMNSFISDDDEKWLMFNTKFSSADAVYESIYIIRSDLTFAAAWLCPYTRI